MNISRAHPTITPSLLYHDAPQAIDWLCAAFGFERQLVVPGDEGSIAHAQLVYGHGMIMLGSAETYARPDTLTSPRHIGGIGTQQVNVHVVDIDAHYRRALAAGAQIVTDIEDKPYGGRGYACRDPEGHVWTFGSYDPWATP